MNSELAQETWVERKITYTLTTEGQFFVIENVPARVCEETGEELFAPDTVERLYALVHGSQTPKRMIETPVYEFAA